MNLYQKAISGYSEAFRKYDADAIKNPEYVTETQARYMLSIARSELDQMISNHNYAGAHNALWHVMCCQSRLDSILYPKQVN